MKANQINDLSQSIDNYINYWRKTLEEVEGVYPQELQSSELKRLISGLKNLIGTYSVSEHNSNYISGNGAATFNPFTRNLMNRLIPGSGVRSEEKSFIHKCIDDDEKVNASKLLRLISMIEHESANLHYAIVTHFWLESEDVRLVAYFDGKDKYYEQINRVREKLEALNNRREVTDLLFNKDWSYLKNSQTSESVAEIERSLNHTRQAIETCFIEETKIDTRVIETRSKMLKSMEALQKRINEVLLKADHNQLIEVKDKAGQEQWSLMKMFDEPRSPSGLQKTEIAKYQRGDEYGVVKRFIAESFGRLCSDYNQIIGVTKEFSDREDFRKNAKGRVNTWCHIVMQKLDKLVDDERTKVRLVKLYETDIMDEMRLANGGEGSLCHGFEKLFTDHASSLSDGNWDEIGDTIGSQKSPATCLKRENIAVFRKTLLTYKDQSSSRRSAFSTINKAIIGLLGLVAGFFAIKGFLSVLPGTLKATQMFATISSMLHLPLAVAILVPTSIITMIVLNMRNAKSIREQFESALAGYESAPKNAVDVGPSVSTYQRFANQVRQVFTRSWWSSNETEQGAQNSIEEEKFVGQELDFHRIEQASFGHLQDDEDGIDVQRSSSFTSVDLSDSPRGNNSGSGMGQF